LQITNDNLKAGLEQIQIEREKQDQVQKKIEVIEEQALLDKSEKFDYDNIL